MGSSLKVKELVFIGGSVFSDERGFIAEMVCVTKRLLWDTAGES